MVFLQHKSGSSCFIKLYLILKEQLLDLVVNKNMKLLTNLVGLEFSRFAKNQNDQNKRLSWINENESFVVDEQLPYGYVFRIGDYDETSIYGLTSWQIIQAAEINNT